jgi:hypothetical protein
MSSTKEADVAKKKKGFIKKATANAHGQFAAKVERAGMSTAAYANKMANSPSADPKTKKQANLAKTLMKLGKKRGKK